MPTGYLRMWSLQIIYCLYQVKLKWSHITSGWILITWLTSILLKIQRCRCNIGECYVKTKDRGNGGRSGSNTPMLRHAKDCWQKLEVAKNDPFLQSLDSFLQHSSENIFVLDLQPLKLWENEFFLIQLPSFMSVGYGSFHKGSSWGSEGVAMTACAE